MRRLLAAVAIAALAGCGGGSDAPRTGPVELVQRLKDGGYVLFLRHALTDRSQEDAPNVDPRDCARQRNLTAAGRAQAREVGNAIEELEIPLGRVETSEFCRTRDTARLAFGDAEVSDVLTHLPPKELRAAHERRLRELRSLFARTPEEGTNTMLVGHITSLEDATGVEIEEGDIVVFEPGGGEDFDVVAILPAAVWRQLLGRVESTAARASRSNGFRR